MNKIFLYDANEERADKYLTKAARWIDVINNNAVYASADCVEVAAMKKEERKELVNYVYGIMHPIIDKQADIYAYKNKMADIEDEFKNIFAMEVYENFYKYNNPRYNRNMYFFSFVTFIMVYIDDAARTAKRELFGYGKRLDDRRRLVEKAREKAMTRYHKDYDDVTVKDIHMCMKYVTSNPLDESEILKVVNATKKAVSVEECCDLAKEECEVITFMDPVVKGAIEDFMSELRPLQQFVFLQNYEYCSDKYAHMSRQELSEDETFIRICEADVSGNDNIIDFAEYKKKKVDEKFIDNQRLYVRKQFAGVVISLGCEAEDLSGKLERIMLECWKSLKIS